MTTEQLARFVLKIRFEDLDEDLGECWLWSASKRSGYGQFGICGIPKASHRLAYEHFVGPIPTNCEIDHLCRHRACVNPRHLEATSHSNNMLRAYFSVDGKARTGAAASKANKGQSKDITPEWLANIRVAQAVTAARLREKSSCRNGHQYIDAYRQKGARRCRTCQRLAAQRWYQKKREQAA